MGLLVYVHRHLCLWRKLLLIWKKSPQGSEVLDSIRFGEKVYFKTAEQSGPLTVSFRTYVYDFLGDPIVLLGTVDM